MQIHVLKAQGLSLREIAHRLGVSRNTVVRYLATDDVPRYKPRAPRPILLISKMVGSGDFCVYQDALVAGVFIAAKNAAVFTIFISAASTGLLWRPN